MATKTVSAGFGVDVREWAAFNKALRKAAPDVAAQLRIGMRAAGEIVADKARTIVEEYSESIPPTIKVRLSGLTVSVQAGGADVPLAGLFEIGNKGSRDSSSFRHPVFGNANVWVDQPTHPYLSPAARDGLPEVEESVGKALDAAVERVSI